VTSEAEYLSSFGRNRGRSLSPRQQSLVDELLPKLKVTPKECSSCSRVMLEIGFGGGEHLVALARAMPNVLMIGCEPYINGVAKLLVAIEEEGLSNIRIATQDAREVMEKLPDDCIDNAYILFPDPWPKARHNKRRLVNQDTLARLARIHKREGELLLATDHYDYATWMLDQIHATPHYRWTAKRATDWLDPPALWVETKYQRKTTEQGRMPQFFNCVHV
jgi:tRNA (guanine-N7-)-methyltransferase